MQLEVVPGEYRPPGLTKEPVYYIDVEKKQASKVIDTAKKIVPPQGSMMQHIKRVKPSAEDPSKLSVLVCETYRISKEELENALETQLGLEFDIKTSAASKYPARSSEEAVEWSKEVWPMMWRGNIKAQPPELSPEEEEFAIKILSEMPDTKDESACCDWCYIIDPKTHETKGFSSMNHQKSDHPLKHTVMEAIDSVAQREHELQDKNNEESGYLCVGLDVFCSQEPCVMCCMGLIHSRINKLFFKRASPHTKGPLEVYCLHGRSQLNHTYETWRVAKE